MVPMGMVVWGGVFPIVWCTLVTSDRWEGGFCWGVWVYISIHMVCFIQDDGVIHIRCVIQYEGVWVRVWVLCVYMWVLIAENARGSCCRSPGWWWLGEEYSWHRWCALESCRVLIYDLWVRGRFLAVGVVVLYLSRTRLHSQGIALHLVWCPWLRRCGSNQIRWWSIYSFYSLRRIWRWLFCPRVRRHLCTCPQSDGNFLHRGIGCCWF